jgi:hypothetical protein
LREFMRKLPSGSELVESFNLRPIIPQDSLFQTAGLLKDKKPLRQCKNLQEELSSRRELVESLNLRLIIPQDFRLRPTGPLSEGRPPERQSKQGPERGFV